MVGDDVALLQLVGFQGRIFAVLSAVDRVANDEGRATGAVVGAGAVVVDPSAELGEHEHYHVIGGVMLFQIVEEALNGFRSVFPQFVVHSNLVGVAIEAAVVAI